jgi:hypothetical protein
MRLLKFSPANNTISVKTFSPYANQYETDASSQFTIHCNLEPRYTHIGTLTNVPSGSYSNIQMHNYLQNTCYQWYATVSDGVHTRTSNVSRFTTGGADRPVTLNVKAFFEGLYDGIGNAPSATDTSVSDSVTLQLHHPYPPFAIDESVKKPILKNGNLNVDFNTGKYNGFYYLSLKHKSSLETWSNTFVILNSPSIAYDFTNAAGKAYGNNMHLLGNGKYGIHCCDVDQNGSININDFFQLEEQLKLFNHGYNNFDLNGDNILDDADYSLMENHLQQQVNVLKP